MLAKLLPYNSKRRKLVKTIARSSGLIQTSEDYHYNNITSQSGGIQRILDVEVPKNGPLISIVVPAYNTPGYYLEPLIDSVVDQSYQNWELVLVNSSDNDDISKEIKEATLVDKRIRVISVVNRGISSTTNRGIDEAKGEYIAFMDHDDTLHPDALAYCASAVINDPDIGLLYSDEDKLSDKGNLYLDPHFKPDWSPDLLNNVNYITHFVVVKKKLALAVDKLDPKKDGAQDYDFIMKVADQGTKITHIPKILYHWRKAKGSTAADFQSKNHVLDAGVKSLEDHFARNAIEVDVKAFEGKPGFYKVNYKPRHAKCNVIFMPLKSPGEEAYVKSIIRSTKSQYNIKFFVPSYLEKKLQYYQFKNISYFSPNNNFLYDISCDSEKNGVTIIINSVALPFSSKWLDDLAGYAWQKHIVAASPSIIGVDNRVIDKGLINISGQYYPLFCGYEEFDTSYFGEVEWTRNVDMLNDNIVAIKNSLLKASFGKEKNIDLDKLLQSLSKQAGYFTVTGHIVFQQLMSRPPGKGKGKAHYNPNLSPFGKDYFQLNSPTLMRTVEFPYALKEDENDQK